MGLLLVAFSGSIAIALVIQIARHAWVLVILVSLSIVVSLADRSTTKAWRQQRQS